MTKCGERDCDLPAVARISSGANQGELNRAWRHSVHDYCPGHLHEWVHDVFLPVATSAAAPAEWPRAFAVTPLAWIEA